MPSSARGSRWPGPRGQRGQGGVAVERRRRRASRNCRSPGLRGRPPALEPGAASRAPAGRAGCAVAGSDRLIFRVIANGSRKNADSHRAAAGARAGRNRRFPDPFTLRWPPLPGSRPCGPGSVAARIMPAGSPRPRARSRHASRTPTGGVPPAGRPLARRIDPSGSRRMRRTRSPRNVRSATTPAEPVGSEDEILRTHRDHDRGALAAASPPRPGTGAVGASRPAGARRRLGDPRPSIRFTSPSRPGDEAAGRALVEARPASRPARGGRAPSRRSGRRASSPRRGRG